MRQQRKLRNKVGFIASAIAAAFLVTDMTHRKIGPYFERLPIDSRLERLTTYGPVELEEIDLFIESEGTESFHAPRDYIAVSKKETEAFMEDFWHHVRTAQNNWDFFEEQFSLVERIYVSPELSEEYLGAVTGKDTIFYFNNKRGSITMIHELAHVWHTNLATREEFEGKWLTISGGIYLGDSWRNANTCDVEKIAGVGDYSTRNLLEDVATTTGFTYALCLPYITVEGIVDQEPFGAPFRDDTKRPLQQSPREFNLQPYSAARLTEKIGLLEEYGFISKRERNYAQEKITASL